MPSKPPRHVNPVYAARRKRTEAERQADKAKRYGNDWRKFRKAYMASHPLCELCEEAGLVVEATDLHHRIKVVDAPHLRLCEWNVQSLCASCHSKITVRGG